MGSDHRNERVCHFHILEMADMLHVDRRLATKMASSSCGSNAILLTFCNLYGPVDHVTSTSFEYYFFCKVEELEWQNLKTFSDVGASHFQFHGKLGCGSQVSIDWKCSWNCWCDNSYFTEKELEQDLKFMRQASKAIFLCLSLVIVLTQMQSCVLHPVHHISVALQ